MLDAPVDAWHVWLGVALVSLVVAGVGTGLPTRTPPDAASAATTVDRVAATDHAATAEHPVEADRARIGPHRIALRDDRGTSRATFAFGPVTPATSGPLRSILEGAPPRQVFDSPDRFRRATERARNRSPAWHGADDRLLVRNVSWEGVNVTIVGV